MLDETNEEITEEITLPRQMLYTVGSGAAALIGCVVVYRTMDKIKVLRLRRQEKKEIEKNLNGSPIVSRIREYTQ